MKNGQLAKVVRCRGFPLLCQKLRTGDDNASPHSDSLHLHFGIGVESLANPDRDVDSLIDQVNTSIGDDKMELQQRMRGKEARHGGCESCLEPERTTQSNEPTRLCLYPKGS